METTENTATEAALTATNNQIELQIVHGDSSGLITLNRDTGEIKFSDDVSYDQWCEALEVVRTTWRKAEIAIADCIAFGTKKWGKIKVEETLEQLEFEATLVKSAIAINTVPKKLRFINLDGDHYVELAKAKLSNKDAAKWAKIASEQRLTASQLRYSIKEGEVVDRAAARQLQTGQLTIQGLRQEFDVWLRRVGGIEGVKSMDIDSKIEILEEVTAICEFGMLLNEHIASLSESRVVEVSMGAA